MTVSGDVFTLVTGGMSEISSEIITIWPKVIVEATLSIVDWSLSWREW